MPPRLQEADLYETWLSYRRVGREDGQDDATIKKLWRRYKMVLLYGIEGSQVPYQYAVEKVLKSRGKTGSEVYEEVSKVVSEMNEKRRKMPPEGHFG